MKNILYFNKFKLNEIATTAVIPNIIKKFVSINNSVFHIYVKNDIYLVNIELMGNIDEAVLKIDFMLQTAENEYSDNITNKGDVLLIMSNVVGVIKYWLSLDIEQPYAGQIVNFKDIVIKGIWVVAKSEIKGDRRRSNIYDYYLLKNFEKIGIDIIEKKDITKNYKDRYKLPEDEIIVMQYKITPTTINNLR